MSRVAVSRSYILLSLEGKVGTLRLESHEQLPWELQFLDILDNE